MNKRCALLGASTIQVPTAIPVEDVAASVKGSAHTPRPSRLASQLPRRPRRSQ